MSDELVYVGEHPDTLADGRPLANGDAIHLTEEQREDQHNQRLIDEQLLVPRPAPIPKRQQKKEGESQ